MTPFWGPGSWTNCIERTMCEVQPMPNAVVLLFCCVQPIIHHDNYTYALEMYIFLKSLHCYYLILIMLLAVK